MKVVQVLDSCSRLAGGISESVKGFAAAITAAGGDVAVISGTDAWTQADAPGWGVLRPRTVPSSGVIDGVLAGAFANVLTAADPDLVHVHGIWGPAARGAAAWTRRTGKAVVVSPHGMLDAWALRQGSAKKRVSRLIWEGPLLGKARFLHALNEAEAASIEVAGWSRPTVIIPNGVALPVTPPSRAPHRRKSLLFVGRLHPKKGLAELVRAWSLLKADVRQGWVLRIAGWDELDTLAGLRAEVAAAGLGESVDFLGPVYGEAKDAVFRDAAAFILPSHSEGLPVAILEAWAYSVPVFMTTACNLPKGFSEGAAIEIATDPVAMARILSASLPNGAALRAIGERGRFLVERDHGWPSIARAMLRAYTQWVG